MGKHSVDVNEANFEQVVIAGSRQAPVLVDFWAEWCGPCRALTPILEKLAEEYQGRFVLAKVNSDRNQGLAASFGVRGIPNVKAFVDGQIVDEFSGALPEAMVRQFIEGLMPSEAENLRRQAAASYAAGDKEAALALLESAAQREPPNDAIRVDRAEVLLDLGRVDEARALLDALNILTRDEPKAAELIARAAFAGGAAEGAADLESRVAANPDDLGARLALAKVHVNAKRFDAAMEQLLEIIRRDRAFGDDVGRKTMLHVFNLLGNEGELVGKYRRLMASALH
ncbi:MAG TPA: co-chaperone YbbN [Pelomicrobium sp.]|nr:co-chaperone YbbN [Pelomicrobium sp.]